MQKKQPRKRSTKQTPQLSEAQLARRRELKALRAAMKAAMTEAPPPGEVVIFTPKAADAPGELGGDNGVATPSTPPQSTGTRAEGLLVTPV